MKWCETGGAHDRSSATGVTLRCVSSPAMSLLPAPCQASRSRSTATFTSVPLGQELLACRLPPLEYWSVSYRKNGCDPDVVAGLTTAAVAIPKAMAYATIAGLLVQAGLYTAFLPMVIYAEGPHAYSA